MQARETSAPAELGQASFPNWRASASAALLASGLATQAQDHLNFPFDPAQQSSLIEKGPDGNCIISQQGPWIPMSWQSTTNVALPSARWSKIPGVEEPAYVNDRELRFEPSEEGAYIFKPVFPNVSKNNQNNYRLYVPTNTPIVGLAVAFHPSTLGLNSGLAFESRTWVTPWMKEFGFATIFPSAQNVVLGENAWGVYRNATNYVAAGPTSADFAAIRGLIRGAQQLIPSLTNTLPKLIALSDGSSAAIAMAQLFPDEIGGILIFSGFNNTNTAKYVDSLSGTNGFRFLPKPMPAVFIDTIYDQYGFDTNEMGPAFQWFSEANSYPAEAPTQTNSITWDINKYVQDATIETQGTLDDKNTHPRPDSRKNPRGQYKRWQDALSRFP